MNRYDLSRFRSYDLKRKRIPTMQEGITERSEGEKIAQRKLTPFVFSLREFLFLLLLRVCDYCLVIVALQKCTLYISPIKGGYNIKPPFIALFFIVLRFLDVLLI